MAELDREFVEVRELIAAGRDSDGRGEPTKLRAEVHVRIPRRVGPYPVFDSYLQVAIGAQELIARLRVKWPDFELVPGLAVETAVDRKQVIERIVEELTESALCGSLEKLVVEVAYVQADQLDLSSTEGDDGDRRGTNADRAFVPALVVYAVPLTPQEDSGEVGFAGLQFVVPLFEASRDASSGEQGERDDA